MAMLFVQYNNNAIFEGGMVYYGPGHCFFKPDIVIVGLIVCIDYSLLKITISTHTS